MVGHQVQNNMADILVKKPIEHGIISNWDDMEALWRYTYSQLSAESTQHPILLSEPTLSPKVQRENITQMFFETFQSPSILLVSQASLALAACGLRKGLVFDSRAGLSETSPVHEGCPMRCVVQILLAKT